MLPDDPNGKGTARLADNASRLGYIQLDNGGLRIISGIAYPNASMFHFCVSATHEMIHGFITLGSKLGYLDGSHQLFYPRDFYSTTEEDLYKTLKDIRIYDESNNKISPFILESP
jgi:hypothetical protein